MVKKGQQRRLSPRKELARVMVSYVASMEDLAKIARNCEILDASISGLLLLVKRKDLIPPSLRGNLNLDMLVGHRIFMRIEDMNLEISGKIARTKFLGKQGFHLAVDYTEESPEYWRECLMDLLPAPGEID
ncbi:MAG: hypothetical protein IPK04_05455 [Bdellovibrionales bacterium]|jgi:hypothetical protein|nr:hypothetical protein [Bdellovibrionales bacterium]MBL7672163.1 hypothetical protein [Pseudobdellovibrionaceae bacterium]